MNSLPLLRRYSAPFGKPEIDRVDPSIFTLRWFLRCMDCNFCHDACCQYGTGADPSTVAVIREHAPGLTPLVGVDAERWFLDGDVVDPDALGGQTRRTRVIDGWPKRPVLPRQPGAISRLASAFPPSVLSRA